MRFQKSQPPSNQQLPASFCKTPGVGVPRRKPTIGIDATSSLPAAAGLFFYPACLELRGEPRGARPACPEPRTERRLRRVATHLGFLSSEKERRRNGFSTNCFRINTCRSVSKQMTLTPFTINTYEKHREGRGLAFPFFSQPSALPRGAGALRTLCSALGALCVKTSLSCWPVASVETGSAGERSKWCLGAKP